MQKWTQGVGAMHHGAEVSRLGAMDHGAEAPGCLLTWIRRGRELGATDHGAELGATDHGAELPTTNRPTPFATRGRSSYFHLPSRLFLSKNRARIWIQYLDHQKFDLFHRS